MKEKFGECYHEFVPSFPVICVTPRGEKVQLAICRLCGADARDVLPDAKPDQLTQEEG